MTHDHDRGHSDDIENRDHQYVLCVACLVAGAGGGGLSAEDWPEFRGEGRLGVWHETGLLEKFPADGLKARWRVPINAGCSGPSVADGRVFVTDFETTQGMRGTERALQQTHLHAERRRDHHSVVRCGGLLVESPDSPPSSGWDLVTENRTPSLASSESKTSTS